MSRKLSISIEKAANELGWTMTKTLATLGIPSCTFWTWKAERHTAQATYASKVMLMLDGLRYRNGEPEKRIGFFRSFFA